MMDISGQADTMPVGQNLNQAESNREQKSFIHEVSEEKSFTSKTSPVLLIALLILAIVVVESFITFGLKATANSMISTQQRNIDNATQAINTSPLKETNLQVSQISAGLTAYTNYKNSHVSYSSLWSDLQARVVPNTSLTALSIDNAGLVKIDGHATNFADIALLIASFNKSTSIKNVVLVSSSSNSKNKDFSLTARYLSSNTNGSN